MEALACSNIPIVSQPYIVINYYNTSHYQYINVESFFHPSLIAVTMASNISSAVTMASNISLAAASNIGSAIRQATRTTQQTASDAKASVLLIGSTGNGKSTLGNFLLDPDETQVKQLFETATDNLPKTKNSHGITGTLYDVDSQYASVKLTVIDTPGLNEGAVKDLKHMINIIEIVKKVGSITACIFVVKFNSKIDTQYKATVRYYAKLLPSLFEKNVFIVMTDYETDGASVARRKKQNISEKQIKINAVQEIVECAGLSYDDPMTFMLDCLPLFDPDKDISMGVRDAIIKYILSLEPITLTNLTVAKTEHLLAIDNAKINEYEGTITGYKERLQQTNNRAVKALDMVQQKEKQVAELNKKIKAAKLELGEKDTDELVTAATWSVDAEWKWFQTQEKGYKLKSQWPICNVRKWTNGRCELEDRLQTTDTLEGVVHGKFMRGLYASITLETKKCMKYQGEIMQLKEDLKVTKMFCSEQEKELLGYRDDYKEYIAEIKSFENFIEQKRKLIIKLSNDKMSIDEAYERLQELQKLT